MCFVVNERSGRDSFTVSFHCQRQTGLGRQLNRSTNNHDRDTRDTALRFQASCKTWMSGRCRSSLGQKSVWTGRRPDWFCWSESISSQASSSLCSHCFVLRRLCAHFASLLRGFSLLTFLHSSALMFRPFVGVFSPTLLIFNPFTCFCILVIFWLRFIISW